jgi:hypothetical protein
MYPIGASSEYPKQFFCKFSGQSSVKFSGRPRAPHYCVKPPSQHRNRPQGSLPHQYSAKAVSNTSVAIWPASSPPRARFHHLKYHRTTATPPNDQGTGAYRFTQLLPMFGPPSQSPWHHGIRRTERVWMRPNLTASFLYLASQHPPYPHQIFLLTYCIVWTRLAESLHRGYNYRGRNTYD